MKKTLILCLLFATQQLFAQKINIDSLIRVAIAHTGTAVFANQNHDSLFVAFQSAKPGTARTKIIYKLINYGQPTSKFGLKYHYKILDWARKNNDPISEAIITAEIAFELALNGEVAEAIRMDLRALKLAKSTGNGEAIGIVYDSMGCCFGLQINADTTKLRPLVNYFQQGAKYSTAAHNDLFISYDLGGLGAVYHSLNKPDSAEYFTLRSFEYAVRKNVSVQISQSLLDITALQTDNQLKLKFAHAAAAISAKMKDTTQSGFACVALARAYRDSNNADSALYYAKRAYNLSKVKSVNGQIAPAQILIELYKGKNTDSTLKYTDIYYKDRDSVFSITKAQRAQAATFADEQQQQEIEKQKAAYAANLRMYLLGIVILFLLLIAYIFWRNNGRIKKDKLKLQQTFDELKATQQQLIQSEKMASLGELTAGIAHEIQNPLNFVNNFSDVSIELIDEMQIELNNGDKNEAIAISEDVKQNLEKIRHHGKRADGIVKGMLQHSRASSGTKEPTDLSQLADEYLRLAYHGLRAKDKSFNSDLVTNFDDKLPVVNIVPQDIGRVMLNLFTNAFYAVQQKHKTAGPDYKPTVEVATGKESGLVFIKVKDNGTGIPDGIKDKILQPFFTTKPTGEGTGLGLSMSYDIVTKTHGGTISIDSKEGEYTEFTIHIPA